MAKGPFAIRVQLDRGFQALGAFEKLGGEAARNVFQKGSLRAATILRTTLVEAYEKGVPGLAPLHGFTVQRKGGTQPLFDSGRLANAVELIIINRGARIDYMVGFTGQDDAQQAATLELGATFAVTDRMRNFLAANGLPLKKTTKFLRIPARPIFLQALEKSQERMRQVLQEEFNKELTRNRLQAKGVGSFWDRMRKRLSKAFR